MTKLLHVSDIVSNDTAIRESLDDATKDELGSDSVFALDGNLEAY